MVHSDQERSSKGFCCPVFPLVHRDTEECAGAVLHPETPLGLPGRQATTGQYAEALRASEKGKEPKLRRETGCICFWINPRVWMDAEGLSVGSAPVPDPSASLFSLPRGVVHAAATGTELPGWGSSARRG